MKKRIEIRQDWKRGFGSAPTGIKNWVKWSLVGFVVYVAVRFVCAFWGGILPMLAVLAVVVFRLLIIVQTQLQFAQTGINKGFPFRIACFVIQIGGIEIFLPRFVILAAVPTIIAGLKHFGGFGYKFAVISPRHNSKNSFAIISILLYIWAKDEKNKK